MQHQSITLLSTHPVLVNTIESDFDLARDWAEGEQEMRRILDTHPGPLFFVSDIRMLKLSFDDLIAGASMGSRGRDPVWHHPNMRSVYFVSDSKLVKMAAAGMKNPAFGNVDVRVFSTMEEVLADVERVMAGS